MQQQLIIIPASGESTDHDAVIQGAAVIDVVTCDGDLTMTLDGTMHMTMRQGDVKHVDPFKRIRLSGSAQTVTLNIGTASEDSRHVGLVPGGPGTVTPADAIVDDNLGLAAGATGMVDTHPIGTTLVKAWLSLDPAAPGPVYILGTTMGGTVGLQLMPGTTTPALAVDYGATGGSHNGIRVYNPNPVAVTVYSHSEYIA